MADNKYDFPLVTTPFGEAEWAYLTKPDTKFDEMGAYKVNLIVNADDPVLQDLLGQAKAILDATVAEATDEAEAKAKKSGRKAKPVKVSEFLPWEELADGRVMLKLKRKAKIITKDGEVKEFFVPLVDGRGTVIPAEHAAGLSIGNGSILRARIELMHYVSATQGVGISFRMKDVQIKKLVEFTGGSGFGDASDGDDDAFTFQAAGGADAGAGYGDADGGQPQYSV